MAKVDLRKYGNFPDYEHQTQRVVPVGLVTSPKVLLKLYAMFKLDPKRGGYSKEWIDSMTGLMKERISVGEIKPESGLGFAILSEDMLNVARWAQSPAYVLKNDLYRTTTKKGFPEIERLDIQADGPFCVYELAIVNRERGAWMTFLRSKQRSCDKREYLDDVFAGEAK